MAFIRTTCSECGRVDVPTSQVRMGFVGGGAGLRLGFSCPGCGERFVRDIDAKLAGPLHDAGVEWGPDPGAPALTPDDLLRFHELLERNDWFDLLLAMEDRNGSGATAPLARPGRERRARS